MPGQANTVSTPLAARFLRNAAAPFNSGEESFLVTMAVFAEAQSGLAAAAAEVLRADTAVDAARAAASLNDFSAGYLN